ncbi:hypothetical protein BH10PLA2_BH10PLA2_30580 [soil metagenome]
MVDVTPEPAKTEPAKLSSKALKIMELAPSSNPLPNLLLPPMTQTDATFQHVLRIPIVRELLNEIETSKIKPLFEANSEKFLTAPAASTMHHNFTHGLLIHTAEVCQSAKAFIIVRPDSAALDAAAEADKDRCRVSFMLDELFTAVFLHDFAKIVQYESADNHSWKMVTMICNQGTWTLRELAAPRNHAHRQRARGRAARRRRVHRVQSRVAS